MDVSVVIPAKNEEENVAPVIEAIVSALTDKVSFEIVYVDDGSDDQTYGELQRLIAQGIEQITPVKHRYSVGQSTAIHTGVQLAQGQLIVTLDADGQNDPADIPKLIDQAMLQPFGTDFCIAGFRKNRKDTSWKRFQSKIANKVRSTLLHDGTPDTGCGLKVFPKSTFLKLPYFNHMHRFLPALVRRLGGHIVVVEVNHLDRQHGVSKYNMLGRLGVGLIDMFGVMWLQRRVKIAEVVSVNQDN
ncbi:MAG: glycosyltransferase family 2 protein [Paraglaciecola sp.]|uniref:glycosyltransferase family 2 protein n=1 Tax=Paraglaciecola sp. TaxID=1920173 RepID=UPI00273DF7ED|nr:glycosyltransferase family 2 protein [Paraglaciecola sp.]MDP5031697.1 glycosyltransferase family 2 protein [Paraglaciecola sp.]MDP5133499.1 glycosyltransferase family 2 protein [Paraglaciecola sp.]